MYLLWYDDSAKKATTAKIKEAMTAYTARFQTQPNVVLVNAEEQVMIAGVEVRCEGYIRRGNFWVGRE